jgi:hypothetical protein
MGCTPLAAQERRTVLLNTNPTRTDTLAYKFENNLTIPIVVRDKGTKLHVWLHTNSLDEKQFQYFNVKKKKDFNSIGQEKIVQGMTSLKMPLNLNSEWNTKDTVIKLIELKDSFTTPYTEKNIIFNNSDPTSAYYSLNNPPKLVVDYEVPQEPYGTSWSQLNGNAQHNNRTDWKLELAEYSTCYLNSFEVLGANSNTSNYLSAYKNKAIIFGKDKNTKPYMAMLRNETSNQELWRLPLEALPAKQPTISPEGKMLFVSEKNTLEIFDLNKVENIKSVPLSDIKISFTKNDSLTINSVADEITLGYDGTIYMPITNKYGKMGIVALTAYPSLKARWFYNTTNPVGPVSLSENEKMTFFIETDIKSKKSRLVVLDNVHGAILNQSDDILGSYTNDNNSYIPPVVLQTADKDTTIVYVLDGNKTSNKLYLFKVHYDQFFEKNGKPKDKASLTHFKLIQSKMNTNEGISQPAVLNKEQVLLIKDRQVFLYNYTTAQFTIVVVGSSEFYKNDASIIIMSPKVKNLYASFVILSENNLLFTTGGGGYRKSLLTSNGNNAVLNPDKSLYIQLKNGSVQHFYPLIEATNSQPTVIKDAADIQHKHTYIYTRDYLEIQKMTISENIQAIIAARREIRIKRGFKVEKGASLTFQIRK